MPFPLLAMLPALMGAMKNQQESTQVKKGDTPDSGAGQAPPGSGGSPGAPGSPLGPNQGTAGPAGGGGGGGPAGPADNPFDLFTAEQRAGADYKTGGDMMSGGMPQGHMMGRVYAPPGIGDFAPMVMGMMLRKRGERTLLGAGDTALRTTDFEQEQRNKQKASEKANLDLQDELEKKRTEAILDQLRKGSSGAGMGGSGGIDGMSAMSE